MKYVSRQTQDAEAWTPPLVGARRGPRSGHCFGGPMIPDHPVFVGLFIAAFMIWKFILGSWIPELLQKALPGDGIYRVIDSGSISALQEHLHQSPASLENPHPTHGTPLFYAIGKGNLEMTEWLLGQKADPNLPHTDGVTPSQLFARQFLRETPLTDPQARAAVERIHALLLERGASLPALLPWPRGETASPDPSLSPSPPGQPITAPSTPSPAPGPR